jgi:hypothetical protein
MNLEGAHILKAKPLRRAATEAAEFSNGVLLGSLGRPRQVADRHVLDHTAATGAYLRHGGLALQGCGEAPESSQTSEQTHPNGDATTASAVSSVWPLDCQPAQKDG